MGDVSTSTTIINDTPIIVNIHDVPEIEARRSISNMKQTAEIAWSQDSQSSDSIDSDVFNKSVISSVTFLKILEDDKLFKATSVKNEKIDMMEKAGNLDTINEEEDKAFFLYVKSKIKETIEESYMCTSKFTSAEIHKTYLDTYHANRDKDMLEIGHDDNSSNGLTEKTISNGVLEIDDNSSNGSQTMSKTISQDSLLRISAPQIRKKDQEEQQEEQQSSRFYNTPRMKKFERIASDINFQFVNEFNNVYKRNNKKGGVKSLRCFPLCTENGHSKSNYCGRGIAMISNSVSTDNLSLDKTNVAIPTKIAPKIFPRPPSILNLPTCLQQQKRNKKARTRPKFDRNRKKYVMLVIGKEDENNLDTVFKKNLVEHYDAISQLNSNRNNNAKKEHDDVGTLIHLDDLINLHNREKVIGEQSIYIVPGDSDTFRVEPSSWVYGWSSGRHSANVNHTVNGYLFHAANHSNSPGNLFICVGRINSNTFNIWSTKRCRNAKLNAIKPIIAPVVQKIINSEKDELDFFVGLNNNHSYNNIKTKRKRATAAMNDVNISFKRKKTIEGDV